MRYINPRETPAYADRIRRRPPGSASLGPFAARRRRLSRALARREFPQGVPSRVYRRLAEVQCLCRRFVRQVQEVESPAVCSMFRTFQGWTALTRQGPGDGTLQLIPIAESMVYVLLRAIQDDVREDDLCGALPGRAL